jgi:hypothetical protein
MIADMHRARHLAWELPRLGWNVEILCPDTTYQPPSCVDEDSTAFFAPDTPVHRVPESRSKILKTIGIRSIGWRAFNPMLRAGRRLLRERKFDVIYFSTTQFVLFLLGPIWREQFGVPFVLDFHDPCYVEKSRRPVWARPSLRHAVGRRLAKIVEARTTLAASGLVAVSPNYIESLHWRYQRKKPAWLTRDRHALIPFAALPKDLREAGEQAVPLVRNTARPVRIVYVGAGGPIMKRSFSLLCEALAQARGRYRNLMEGVRIELFGTMLGWRDGDPRHLTDFARERGVADLISENPHRVSYRRSLELLLASDGALILGVDDSGYMPSKLFSYALSGKPLLASLRRDSPAFAQFHNTPELGHVLWFDESVDIPTDDAVNVVKSFLEQAIARRSFERRTVLEPYLSPAMARRHVELFEACL